MGSFLVGDGGIPFCSNSSSIEYQLLCGVGGRGYNPSHKGGDAERYVLQEECDAAANMNKIQIQPVIFVVKNK